MLTLQMLKDMKPNTAFAQGEIIDSPTGINMTNSGKMLKWVAKRGEEIHDWSIYCLWAHNFYEAAKIEKVTSEVDIKKLVPCDNEAFKMYAL